MKIKLEAETEPPLGFNTEAKPLLAPIPFSVNTYTLPDLLAGKICAMLCRQWKRRVKGRDWYDFLWFIQKKSPFI
ncbi:MAG: nucleotidyl transferase AbiEii/AbiGii toxin family protein [Gammaproteobacteria bacterium]